MEASFSVQKGFKVAAVYQYTYIQYMWQYMTISTYLCGA